MTSQIVDNRELQRILSAAAVSESFRRLLLVDPVQALAQGYQGERFRVDSRSHSFLKSLRVSTLSEFAQQCMGGFEPEALAAQD